MFSLKYLVYSINILKFASDNQKWLSRGEVF